MNTLEELEEFLDSRMDALNDNVKKYKINKLQETSRWVQEHLDKTPHERFKTSMYYKRQIVDVLRGED